MVHVLAPRLAVAELPEHLVRHEHVNALTCHALDVVLHLAPDLAELVLVDPHKDVDRERLARQQAHSLVNVLAVLRQLVLAHQLLIDLALQLDDRLSKHLLNAKTPHDAVQHVLVGGRLIRRNALTDERHRRQVERRVGHVQLPPSPRHEVRSLDVLLHDLHQLGCGLATPLKHSRHHDGGQRRELLHRLVGLLVERQKRTEERRVLRDPAQKDVVLRPVQQRKLVRVDVDETKPLEHVLQSGDALSTLTPLHARQHPQEVLEGDCVRRQLDCEVRVRETGVLKKAGVQVTKVQLRRTLILEPVDDCLRNPLLVLEELAQLAVLTRHLQLPNRLEVRPSEERGVQDHFRKLLHDLNEAVVVRPQVVDRKLELALCALLVEVAHPSRHLNARRELTTDQGRVQHDHETSQRPLLGQVVRDLVVLVEVLPHRWRDIAVPVTPLLVGELAVVLLTNLNLRVLGHKGQPVRLEREVLDAPPGGDHVDRHTLGIQKIHNILEPVLQTHLRQHTPLVLALLLASDVDGFAPTPIQISLVDRVWDTVRRRVRHPENQLLEWREVVRSALALSGSNALVDHMARARASLRRITTIPVLVERVRSE